MRQLRIEYEGAFYHVTSRGNQKEQIFWDDKDREEFKRILKRTKERYGYLLHAYVLMDNHYHLVVETPYANIKQVMQNINTSYTVYVNRKHGRVGHLLQGRYKAFIVDKESYLLELGRYIHLNPVRAGVVGRPSDYRWSSYRDYVDRSRQEAITDTDEMLDSFSKVRTVAVKKYQEFVEAGINEKSPLEKAVGSILGDETFRERVIGYLKGIPDKTEILELKKIGTKHEIEDIVKVASEYYGVRENELLKRKGATKRQRKIAIYLCKTLSGKKNVEVGRVFGITIQAVTNAIRDIEKMMGKDRKLSKEIALIKKTVEK
jgi:REP element-mobilizing transposase RayT/DNA-binding CsgD family transcriptional regulator